VERLQEIGDALGVAIHELLRFGPAGRHHERDAAMDRLVALLADRSAADLDLIADLAQRIFRR
jgi:transposase